MFIISQIENKLCTIKYDIVLRDTFNLVLLSVGLQ